MYKVRTKETIRELTRIARHQRHKSLYLLQAKTVEREARPASSPLHKYFSWDDTEAAYQWRLQEARQLINAVVEVIGPKNKSVETRVFVSLSNERGRGYRSMVQVLSDHELRSQLLADALADMERLRSKYNSLKELADVFAAMTAVERKLTLKRAAVA